MTFYDRIEFERLILESINKNYSTDKHLYGLTYPALEEWRTRVKVSQEIVDILRSIIDHMIKYKKSSSYSFMAEVKIKLDPEPFLNLIESIFDK